MSYFYIDSTIGIRTTGGGTTKQSGSFDTLGAATCYAKAEDAVTDGAGAGDFLVLAFRHAETTAGLVKVLGPVSGDPLSIIVAENANCDIAAIATSSSIANTVATSDLEFWGILSMYGVWATSTDFLSFKSRAQTLLRNCVLENTAADNVIVDVSGDGCCVRLEDTELKSVAGTYPFRIRGGSSIEIVGGALTGGATLLTRYDFTTGGGRLVCRGFDMSGVTDVVIKDVGANTASENAIDVQFYDCKTAATFSWTNEDFKGQHQRLQAYRCANTSAHAEYQFHVEARGGYVDDQADSGIHRDETTAFPSGTKVSAHILTNTDASIAAPFWFDISSIYAELSSASTDVLRFYLASTVALDDTDIGIVITYPDGTNNESTNLVSTRNTNPLLAASAGTALQADSGSTWKNGASDLVGYNEYYIDVDTSVDVGADCVPSMRVYVSIPSTAIYLDLVPDVVA